MRLVNIAISEPQPHQHGHWTAVVAQEIHILVFSPNVLDLTLQGKVIYRGLMSL